MNVAEQKLYDVFRKVLKLSDESATELLQAFKEYVDYKIKESANSHIAQENIHKMDL